MKNNDIESILRNCKPKVKDNPTFLLEVQRKMHAVEGIKNEVDRQRRYGISAIIVTFALGLAAGALAISFAYLYPVDPSSFIDTFISGIRVVLDTYRQYWALPIGGCAIALGLILGRKKSFI